MAHQLVPSLVCSACRNPYQLRPHHLVSNGYSSRVAQTQAFRPASSVFPWQHRPSISQRCRFGNSRARGFACAASSTTAKTAKDAVEAGLKQFQEKKYEAALELFQTALALDPRPEEAQAALYNSACSQVKLKQWQAATDSVAEAVNSYNLRLKVALEDKDLAPLRERREWRDAVEAMQGALSSKNLVSVRAEQRSPFRLFRLTLAGGLGAGALLGLLLILARLLGALKGGEGAPELGETLQNLAINGAAVAVLGFIFNRDLKGSRTDRRIIEREEALARLQVKLGEDRVVTIDTLRGTTRPVLVTGTKGQVSRAIKAAGPFIEALRTRGVCVIPLVLSEDDPSAKLAALKAEFRPSKGFGKAGEPEPVAAAPVSSAPAKEDAPAKPRRFELEPYDTSEWRQWLKSLQAEAKVTGEHLFVQIQLDGSVRSSGVGQPPWQRFCDDLAPLDSLRTRITDGRRR